MTSLWLHNYNTQHQNRKPIRGCGNPYSASSLRKLRAAGASSEVSSPSWKATRPAAPPGTSARQNRQHPQAAQKAPAQRGLIRADGGLWCCRTVISQPVSKWSAVRTMHCNIPRLRSYSICQLSKMSRPSNAGSPPVAEDAMPMAMSYPTMRSSSEKYIVASSLKYSAPPPMPPTSARLPSLSRGISRLVESFECRQVESAPVSSRNITGPDMFNRGIATTPWI